MRLKGHQTGVLKYQWSGRGLGTVLALLYITWGERLVFWLRNYEMLNIICLYCCSAIHVASHITDISKITPIMYWNLKPGWIDVDKCCYVLGLSGSQTYVRPLTCTAKINDCLFPKCFKLSSLSLIWNPENTGDTLLKHLVDVISHNYTIIMSIIPTNKEQK